MDRKRLSYLIYCIEEDMKLYCDNKSSEQPNEPHQWTPNLQSLFEHREKETEPCNMLLLLMLAALEYSIPSEVMLATLETAKLISIG